MKEMNEKLLKDYHATAKALNLNDNILNKFSPPLLLKIPDKYQQTQQIKIIVFGQETQGWGFSNSDKKVTNFLEFKNMPDSEKHLSNFYQKFCFAKNSSHKKSPFWRAFRSISQMKFSEESFETNVIWNNLIKVDYNRASIRKCNKEFQEYCVNYSKQIIDLELKILQPSVCIFLLAQTMIHI